ncbi:hypothetical protein NQ176_g511 [Zarea fungicola]|uniref:Uncharacterized protein n=1 Tax=Zarea fungicola TaxID=93591 RepID=A0ACC1NZ44_9HYPO|nr:hypothetical protein NQ176_g511 [Lecanicillium fungicola]
MRLLSLLAFLPLLVAAQVTLPEDALSGLAIHLKDESGNAVYVHESEFDKYGIVLQANPGTNSTNQTSLAKRGPPKDYRLCDEPVIDVEDLRNGLIDFADSLACGTGVVPDRFAPYTYVAISWYHGSTVLYICNYWETSAIYSGPDLVDYVSLAFNYCGMGNKAAWYHVGGADISYGYTNVKNWFCGVPV